MKKMRLKERYHKQFPRSKDKEFEVRPHAQWPGTCVMARAIGSKKWTWWDKDCFA